MCADFSQFYVVTALLFRSTIISLNLHHLSSFKSKQKRISKFETTFCHATGIYISEENVIQIYVSSDNKKKVSVISCIIVNEPNPFGILYKM